MSKMIMFVMLNGVLPWAQTGGNHLNPSYETLPPGLSARGQGFAQGDNLVRQPQYLMI